MKDGFLRFFASPGQIGALLSFTLVSMLIPSVIIILPSVFIDFDEFADHLFGQFRTTFWALQGNWAVCLSESSPNMTSVILLP